MANIETVREQTEQETISPVQIPSIDRPQIRERKHYQPTSVDLLLRIKEFYDNWPATEYDGTPLERALFLCQNNRETSRNVSLTTLLKIKRDVPELLKEQDISLGKMIKWRCLNGYTTETIRRFKNHPGLKADILIKYFEKCPGMDSKSFNKREIQILKDMYYDSHKPAKIETQNVTKEPKRKKIIPQPSPEINVSTLKTPAEIPQIREIVQDNQITLTPEELPSIEVYSISNAFFEKLKKVQALKNTFSNVTIFPERISLEKAIKLVHPEHSDTERRPSFFNQKYKEVFESWLQNNLPKYSFNNIDDIDKSFFIFLKANPKLIDLFNQGSLTGLNESSLEEIITSFPGECYYTVQKTISKSLAEIFQTIHFDNETIQRILEECHKKIGYEVDSENEIKIRDLVRKTCSKNLPNNSHSSLPEIPQQNKRPYYGHPKEKKSSLTL